MKEILVSSDQLEDRVALVQNGRLEEIFIGRGERTVGSIYKGRVANVLPGMQAAFVDIGIERNTFLCLDDALPMEWNDELGEQQPAGKHRRGRRPRIQDLVKVGEEKLVQVVKEPIGTKGGRITTNVSLPGRYLVLLPQGNYIGISRRVERPQERERLRTIAKKIKSDGMGLIIRTVAEGKEEELLKQDLDQLVASWRQIEENVKTARAPAVIHQEVGLTDRALRDLFSEDVEKIMVDSRTVYDKITQYIEADKNLSQRVYYYEGAKPLFELYGVEAEIDKLFNKKVRLPSGGTLVIEPTEALTVIDVNTGKYVGKRSLDDTILKTNLEAAAEIARQIRLRDISGIIVVDFIDMERREDRKELLVELEEQFKKDRVHATVFGITTLGLVEITRKRAGKNIDRLYREECYYCSGHGRLETPETVGIKLDRKIRQEAANATADALWVIAHPQVALIFAGWEGERLQSLESAIGKKIFLRVDPGFHQEKFTVRWDALSEIEKEVKMVQEGEVIQAEIESLHPLNAESGITFIHGEIVEIPSIGEKVGEKVLIRIEKTSPSYAVGAMVRE